MSAGKVIIIMGSASDRELGEGIRSRLQEWGIGADLRVASAHKSAQYLLNLLAEYESQPGPRVYIAIAGRSNALAGLIDANVVAPVITCPPYSDRFAGADLYSSLRMPSGVSPMVVLEPDNAALAAAKILGLGDSGLQEAVSRLHKNSEEKIIKDDNSLKNS